MTLSNFAYTRFYTRLTLLRLTDKEAGKIQFFGLDMEQNERQIKDRLGIVLDDGCFYEELSLSEMKSIIAPAYTAWSERDFKQYMDMFSLDPKQKINTLSKGMRMKYALALALSHEAELLIMDEPTSGLDPLVRSPAHPIAPVRSSPDFGCNSFAPKPGSVHT